MKNLFRLSYVVIFNLIWLTQSYAVAPGTYIGINAGMGNTQVKSSGSKKTTSNTGAAGGALVGYQFNNYGAFELGYTHWTNGTSTQVPSCGSPVIRNDSINLLGKGVFPLAHFSVYGKGGLAILRTTGGGSCASGRRKTTYTAKPAVGIGASYDLTQNWVAGLSYTRLFVNSSQVTNTSLTALEITYHFVDKYCGQFLC